MSLHTIAPEVAATYLTENHKRAIANFLYSFNGLYGVAINTAEEQWMHYYTYDTCVPHRIGWDYIIPHYGNIGTYGNHTFDMGDITIYNGELPSRVEPKEYVRHD